MSKVSLPSKNWIKKATVGEVRTKFEEAVLRKDPADYLQRHGINARSMQARDLTAEVFTFAHNHKYGIGDAPYDFDEQIKRLGFKPGVVGKFHQPGKWKHFTLTELAQEKMPVGDLVSHIAEMEGGSISETGYGSVKFLMQPQRKNKFKSILIKLLKAGYTFHDLTSRHAWGPITLDFPKLRELFTLKQLRHLGYPDDRLLQAMHEGHVTEAELKTAGVKPEALELGREPMTDERIHGLIEAGQLKQLRKARLPLRKVLDVHYDHTLKGGPGSRWQNHVALWKALHESGYTPKHFKEAGVNSSGLCAMKVPVHKLLRIFTPQEILAGGYSQRELTSAYGRAKRR